MRLLESYTALSSFAWVNADALTAPPTGCQYNAMKTVVLMLRDAVNVAKRWEGNINPLFMNVGGPVSVAQWNSALDF